MCTSQWDVLSLLCPGAGSQVCVSAALWQLQLLALPALQCLLLGWCAGLPCGPWLSQGWGLSLIPSLPHDMELCLGAWGRRRILDVSDTRQLMELNLSGAHHLQPCRCRCRCQVVSPWCLDLGWPSWAPPAQPAGGQHTSPGCSLLRDQPCRLPQHVLAAWWLCDTRRRWHREVPDKSCKGRI